MGDLRKKLFKKKGSPKMASSHSGGAKMLIKHEMRRERKPKTLNATMKSSKVLVDKRTKNEKERDKNLR